MATHMRGLFGTHHTSLFIYIVVCLVISTGAHGHERVRQETLPEPDYSQAEKILHEQASMAENLYLESVGSETLGPHAREKIRKSRIRKLGSAECVFWKHYFLNKENERGLEKVKEYCF